MLAMVKKIFQKTSPIQFKSSNFEPFCFLNQGPLKKWIEHSQELHLLKSPLELVF